MTRDDLVAAIDLHLLKEFFEGPPRDKNGAWDSWQSASNILQVIEQAGMLKDVEPESL